MWSSPVSLVFPSGHISTIIYGDTTDLKSLGVLEVGTLMPSKLLWASRHRNDSALCNRNTKEIQSNQLWIAIISLLEDMYFVSDKKQKFIFQSVFKDPFYFPLNGHIFMTEEGQ